MTHFVHNPFRPKGYSPSNITELHIYFLKGEIAFKEAPGYSWNKEKKALKTSKEETDIITRGGMDSKFLDMLAFKVTALIRNEIEGHGKKEKDRKDATLEGMIKDGE